MVGDVPNETSVERLNEISTKFGRDPSRVLAALADSRRDGATEEGITLILPIVEAQNVLFPPNEFSARWRFGYARAVVSRLSARLTSRPYFSASRERFSELAAQGRILAMSSAALRDEFGHAFYDRLCPRVTRLTDAPKTLMAFRSFAEEAFREGDFQSRAPRDWMELLLDCMIQFYPPAAAEIRLERYPWEAIPAQEGTFLARVREQAKQIRDPTAAIQDAFASF